MSSALTAAATSGRRETLGAYPQSAPPSSPVVVSTAVVTTPTVPPTTPVTVPSRPPRRPAWAGGADAVSAATAKAATTARSADRRRGLLLRSDIGLPRQGVPAQPERARQFAGVDPRSTQRPISVIGATLDAKHYRRRIGPRTS